MRSSATRRVIGGIASKSLPSDTATGKPFAKARLQLTGLAGNANRGSNGTSGAASGEHAGSITTMPPRRVSHPPQPRIIMTMKSGNRDKAEGTAKDLKGRAKESAGVMGNNPRLKREGRADQGEGRVQKAVGHLKKAAGR